MAIQFVVDSASDILPEEAKKLGIRLLPMTVCFGDEQYADAVDLTHRAFYEKLVESSVMPTTSQIPPAVFETVFREIADHGDTAVVITISSKVSGTFQSARIAAEEFEGQIFVVDSENVCVGQRILTLRGLELREQGLTAAQIVQELDREKHRIRVMALLDTLEYLKKGGRISAAVALAGGMLSIKPVIAVENGAVVMAGKARGSRQGNNLLRELVKKCGGINFDKPFALGYSGLSDALLKKYVEDSAEIWEGHGDKLEITTIGCTIGAHAGPGAVAVAFFEK